MKLTLLIRFAKFLRRKRKKTVAPSKTTWKKSLPPTLAKSNLKKIRLKVDHISPKMCVYRIWFGEKYYIGSTIDLIARMKWHYRTINDCFAGKRVGKNSQTNIMNHLMDNPEITEGLVEIICFCKNERELVTLEKAALLPIYKHPNCLNERSHTTRRIDGILVRD